MTLEKKKIGYLSALFAAILFGSVSTLAKPTLTTIDPMVLSSMVYFLAAIVSTPIAQRTKFSLNRKDWKLLLAIALSGAVVAPVLFFIGLEQTTASDTAILGNGEIFFSVLFALIFFKERIGRIGSIAVIMIIAGVVIVTTNLEFSETSFDFINIGNMLVFGATVFWALDNNLSKIISNRMDVARIVQLKSAIGCVILLSIILVFQIPFDIELDQIPNILLLGTLGFGLSIFLFIHGLKRIGTVKTIMIFSTSAVFGLVFASVFLNEQISLYQIVAIIIMLSGLYLLHKKE
jgi:drug/metabolite transporter (DMT)-like permease